MVKAPTPKNEPERLAALYSLSILYRRPKNGSIG